MIRKWLIKHGHAAERSSFRFTPAAFSHAGQAHGDFKAFAREQARRRLIDFEGEAKSSRIRSATRRWSSCISMAIAKAVSRSVAFKAARMREAIVEDQSESIVRRSGGEEVGSEVNKRATLEGIGAELWASPNWGAS